MVVCVVIGIVGVDEEVLGFWSWVVVFDVFVVVGVFGVVNEVLVWVVEVEVEVMVVGVEVEVVGDFGGVVVDGYGECVVFIIVVVDCFSEGFFVNGWFWWGVWVWFVFVIVGLVEVFVVDDVNLVVCWIVVVDDFYCLGFCCWVVVVDFFEVVVGGVGVVNLVVVWVVEVEVEVVFVVVLVEGCCDEFSIVYCELVVLVFFVWDVFSEGEFCIVVVVGSFIGVDFICIVGDVGYFVGFYYVGGFDEGCFDFVGSLVWVGLEEKGGYISDVWSGYWGFWSGGVVIVYWLFYVGFVGVGSDDLVVWSNDFWFEFVVGCWVVVWEVGYDVVFVNCIDGDDFVGCCWWVYCVFVWFIVFSSYNDDKFGVLGVVDGLVEGVGIVGVLVWVKGEVNDFYFVFVFVLDSLVNIVDDVWDVFVFLIVENFNVNEFGVWGYIFVFVVVCCIGFGGYWSDVGFVVVVVVGSCFFVDEVNLFDNFVLEIGVGGVNIGVDDIDGYFGIVVVEVLYVGGYNLGSGFVEIFGFNGDFDYVVFLDELDIWELCVFKVVGVYKVGDYKKIFNFYFDCEGGDNVVVVFDFGFKEV